MTKDVLFSLLNSFKDYLVFFLFILYKGKRTKTTKLESNVIYLTCLLLFYKKYFFEYLRPIENLNQDFENPNKIIFSGHLGFTIKVKHLFYEMSF